jgi:predicted nucleic acid-binding protein
VTIRERALERAIPAGALIALDASATLAYLTGTELASPVATWIFEACVGRGRNPAIVSTVTAAELLVRPFRAGPDSVGIIEGFLRFYGIRLVDVTYGIAREAARIRALTGLPMPDAIVIGSAIDQAADIVVTNDRRWPSSIPTAGEPLRVVRTSEFVSGSG